MSEQGFTLRIYVTGLVVLVPREKFKKKKLFILCANASSPERIWSITGSDRLEPHRTVILYRVANRKSQFPNYPLFQDSGGHLNGLWVLDREDVRIQKDGQDGIEICDQLDAKIQESRYNNTLPDILPLMPKDNNRNDISWLSPMRDACGNKLLARDNFTGPRCYDPHDDLSARMIVSCGELKTSGFNFSPETGTFMINQIADVEQATAHLARIDIPIKENKVTLYKENFMTKLPLRPLYEVDHLTLRPEKKERTDEGEERIVEIMLLNMELSEILGQRMPIGRRRHLAIRYAMEQAFLARLLSHPEKYNTPDYLRSFRSKRRRKWQENDQVMHEPWLWMTPGLEQETPPPRGTCDPFSAG